MNGDAKTIDEILESLIQTAREKGASDAQAVSAADVTVELGAREC